MTDSLPQSHPAPQTTSPSYEPAAQYNAASTRETRRPGATRTWEPGTALIASRLPPTR